MNLTDGFQVLWNGHIEEYLRILDDADKQEDFEEDPDKFTKELIEKKLKEARERLEKYEGYQKLMEESGQSQISITDADEPVKSIYGTQDEMMARAAEGYFVRDPERNLVYCPNREIHRQKCIKKNGNIRCANKNAYRHCPNRNKLSFISDEMFYR